MKTVELLNARLSALTFTELLTEFDSGFVVFHNLDTLRKLQDHRDFRDACATAQYQLADGQVVVLASRLLGSPVPERISGSDFLGAFCRHHRADDDVRVFLLGAAPGVAAEAARRINDRAGRAVVVDSFSPAQGFERDDLASTEVVDRINRSGATVLAVALGAPRQELWIAAHRTRLPAVTRFLPVGATLDFEAGRVRRAPAWVSRAGFEWLYRLGTEPRRLWRRYLLEGPRVLVLLCRQRVGRYRDPFADPADAPATESFADPFGPGDALHRTRHTSRSSHA